MLIGGGDSRGESGTGKGGQGWGRERGRLRERGVGGAVEKPPDLSALMVHCYLLSSHTFFFSFDLATAPSILGDEEKNIGQSRERRTRRRKKWW